MRLISGIAAAIGALFALVMAVGVTGTAVADPPVPITPAEALAKAFATPRFYAIAASGEAKSRDGTKMCMGGELLRKFVSTFAEAAKDKTLADVGKGCTTKTERPTPTTVAIEQVCERSAGASFDSRTKISGSPDEMHQHMELTWSSPIAGKPDRVTSSDTTMTYLGTCPVNVKPGQFVERDGKISDPLAELRRLSEQPRPKNKAAGPSE